MTPPCVVPTFRPYTVENLEFGGFYASSCESRVRLDLHAEYLHGVAPEYRELVIIAEAGRRHDVIDRMVLPRIGMIAAEHDLANAHLRG